MDISLQRIEEIKLQDDTSTNAATIEQILRDKIRTSELPDFFYAHLAGIIVEEIPSNGQELYELIGEFIQNGNKINKLNAQKVCNEIAETLISQKIVKQNLKFHFVAEKLNQPIQLMQVQLMKGDDINSGYEDAFRGIKKEANTNDQMDPNQFQKNKKKKEKEMNKTQELFLRYQNEQTTNSKKLPPIQVRHHRNQDCKSMDLVLDKITLIVGGRALLEDTQVRLTYGRKYGLVGRNGIGKTCFMNALARGEFEKTPLHLQILLVEQEISGIDKTPLEYVLETDIDRTRLLEEEQNIVNRSNSSQKDDQRLVEINKELEVIEAHTAESRAQQILGGLGFTQEMMRCATKLLSGGWRMRVALARALFVQPDILLLDEPTNHLDLDAVMWLEDYIVSSKICIVVVSHAREFLNVVCSEIIHFYENTLTYYKGNYDQFEKTRSERLKMKLKQFEAQQLKLAHMQEFIDRFRYNAKRASLVQSRLKAINKMELIDEVVEDPSCVFIFPTPDKLRPPLLKIEDGSFGYNKEKPILKGINLTVDCESRYAIVGANGVGKSTLLKLLVGELALFEGNQYRNNRLRCSLFTQHHVDQLDLMLSPLEQLMRDYPGASSEAYRSHLGSFGITGNLALRPNYLLSGGQKSRVAFALAVYQNPHVLILDEPTNHLDIDAVNALIIALNNYCGGVVIVSHDQHLISTVCDQIWYIKESRLKKFNGDFEDYRIALASNKL